MNFQELCILLPCHSLEDFPLHHEGEEAEGLLAAWTALWHPALLASAGKIVTWFRAEDPPEEPQDRLIVIPEVSESLLMAGWPARAEKEGACVIRKTTGRDEILATALAALDGGAGGVDDDLAADFLALGFAYLQTELLTRQMRYMSLLDETHLGNEAVEAAQAAVAGDAEKARAAIRGCFDVLAEARERFYPVDAYLVDLTLVAPTTIGPALRRSLADPRPTNLLVSGETLQTMAREQPETLAAVREALDSGRASLVGGELAERELPLLPLESVLDSLHRGVPVYEELLGRRPKIYGRRRHGLTPVLPLVLSRFGFEGALHLTLDDGHFPRGQQSKSRWEGSDGSSIDAVARVPLDANSAAALLGFPERMGESMDLDHVATVTFAHWPGTVCPWYEDLQRAASYGPVFGKFVTLDEYFRDTDAAGDVSHFLADDYRAPYLQQAIVRRETDPLSTVGRHYQRLGVGEAAATLSTLASLLSGEPDETTRNLLDEVERTATSGEAADGLEDRLREALDASAARLAAALPKSNADRQAGRLVFNPLSFTRRTEVELPPEFDLPAIEGPVSGSQAEGDRKSAIVDIPAMGYAWIAAEAASTARSSRGRRREPPLAEENTLRNEHFEIFVDPETGGIRSLRDYKQRGNRLSQQLSFRLPAPRPKPGDLWRDPDTEAQYAVMTAEAVEVTRSGSAVGEIVSRGNLLDPEGQRLAGFRQTMRVVRGSPVLMLDIELDVEEEPRADPWKSYYAARFAWGDQAADLWRGTADGRHRTGAKRIEAPYFVEIESSPSRTVVLAGGQPYHRKIGYRMLDTLLVVRGESRRQFRLGLGIDVKHPMQSALSLLTPLGIADVSNGPPSSGESSWLFHVDRQSVVATHWEPIFDDGRAVGFRARLLETEGRGGRALLRTFRPAASARHVDFNGETLTELTVEEDGIVVDFTAHEWIEVEARWS